MDDLVLTAMPPVVALLVREEKLRGRALTEAEVIAVRDGAQCVALPPDVAHGIAENRGYADLDLATVWESWQAFRRAYPDLISPESPLGAEEPRP